jgi:hypothetical protein
MQAIDPIHIAPPEEAPVKKRQRKSDEKANESTSPPEEKKKEVVSPPTTKQQPKVRKCSICGHPLKGLTHPECTYELIEKRNQREAKKEQALKKKKEEVPMCIVCISARAEYAITPCGHMCACVSCYKKISDNCPVCRASIDQIIKIFTV